MSLLSVCAVLLLCVYLGICLASELPDSVLAQLPKPDRVDLGDGFEAFSLSASVNSTHNRFLNLEYYAERTKNSFDISEHPEVTFVRCQAEHNAHSNITVLTFVSTESMKTAQDSLQEGTVLFVHPSWGCDISYQLVHKVLDTTNGSLDLVLATKRGNASDMFRVLELNMESNHPELYAGDGSQCTGNEHYVISDDDGADDDDEWYPDDNDDAMTNWDDIYDDDVTDDHWVYCFSRQFSADTYFGSLSYMPTISVKYQINKLRCISDSDDCVGIARVHATGPATFALTTNGQWQNSDYPPIKLFQYNVPMDLPSIVASVPVSVTLQPFSDFDVVMPNNHISMSGKLEMMAQYQSATGWNGQTSHHFTFNNDSHSVPNAEVEGKLGVVITPSIGVNVADYTLFAELYAPVTCQLNSYYFSSSNQLCIVAGVKLSVTASGGIDSDWAEIHDDWDETLMQEAFIYQSGQYCINV